MTLFDRTTYCLKLASETDDVDACDAYIAEATGLMGKPLAESLHKHLSRYELGVRDRETMLKLERTLPKVEVVKVNGIDWISVQCECGWQPTELWALPKGMDIICPQCNATLFCQRGRDRA